MMRCFLVPYLFRKIPKVERFVFGTCPIVMETAAGIFWESRYPQNSDIKMESMIHFVNFQKWRGLCLELVLWSWSRWVV